MTTNRTAARVVGLFLALLSIASAACAGDFAYFKTPSANIYCAYFEGDSAPEVRCDIRAFSQTTGKRPADCDLEWGDSFAVGAESGRGLIVCHGDTVIEPSARTLGYGKSFNGSGITCLSEQSGLTCKNRKGHGFKLSKKKQSVF